VISILLLVEVSGVSLLVEDSDAVLVEVTDAVEFEVVEVIDDVLGCCVIVGEVGSLEDCEESSLKDCGEGSLEEDNESVVLLREGVVTGRVVCGGSSTITEDFFLEKKFDFVDLLLL
jgi:hypothetical protein